MDPYCTPTDEDRRVECRRYAEARGYGNVIGTFNRLSVVDITSGFQYLQYIGGIEPTYINRLLVRQLSTTNDNISLS